MDERNPDPQEGECKFTDFKFQGDKTFWLDYACERKVRMRRGSLRTSAGEISTEKECLLHEERAIKRSRS